MVALHWHENIVTDYQIVTLLLLTLPMPLLGGYIDYENCFFLCMLLHCSAFLCLRLNVQMSWFRAPTKGGAGGQCPGAAFCGERHFWSKKE